MLSFGSKRAKALNNTIALGLSKPPQLDFDPVVCGFLLVHEMIIEIETGDGPKKVRVCDYCKTACIPYGQFCSSRCYHRHLDAIVAKQEAERQRQLDELREWEENRNGR